MQIPKNDSVVGRRSLATLTAVLIATTTGVASAQSDADITDYVPESEIAQSSRDKEGVDGTLSLASTINLNQNRRVVGQVDGFSLLFGFNLVGGLDYVRGAHELRNTLSISQSWARTPVVDEFTKSNDILDIESLYSYFILSWFGPFARLNLETSMLLAEDIRAEPVDYLISRTDGTQDVVRFEDRLKLANGFEPLTINESIGFFAEPFQEDAFSLSIRLGFGARETFADGVLVLSDDDATPIVEVTELENVYQGGAELFVGASGSVKRGRVAYNIGASALVPFLNNDPEERDAIDLTKIGLVAGLNFTVFEWMSINYQFKLLDDPQLLDELQVQNNLLFTFSYTFIERNENLNNLADIKAEEAKEAAAEEEKKKAAEAEKRAAEAEAEAQRLREELDAAKKASEEKKEEEKAPAPPAEEAPAPEGDGGDGGDGG